MARLMIIIIAVHFSFLCAGKLAWIDALLYYSIALANIVFSECSSFTWHFFLTDPAFAFTLKPSIAAAAFQSGTKLMFFSVLS